jgi:Tfp pilus assembly protein PilE
MQRRNQAGLSLAGFMFVVVILGLAAVLAMQIVPSATEYMAVKKAVTKAANTGSTPREVQESFEKQRTTAYIESVTAKDLQIVKTENGFKVSVAYQKKIPLVGPASLVLDYEASSR